jgi:hypothetical protein
VLSITQGIASIITILSILLIFKGIEESYPAGHIARDRAKNLLGNIKGPTDSLLEIPELFVDSFTQFFGDTWSFRRLFISWSISIIIVCCLYFIFSPLAHTGMLTSNIIKFNIYILLKFMVVVTIVNFIPDYISIQETLFVFKAAINKPLKCIFLLAIADLLFTVVIFVGLSSLIIYYFFENPYDSLKTFFISYLQECSPINMGIASSFLISTFFSSFLFFLFFLSILASRSIYWLGNIGTDLMETVVIKEKPFFSMGILAAIALLFINFSFFLIELFISILSQFIEGWPI